jgi:hypothetical protein
MRSGWAVMRAATAAGAAATAPAAVGSEFGARRCRRQPASAAAEAARDPPTTSSCECPCGLCMRSPPSSVHRFAAICAHAVGASRRRPGRPDPVRRLPRSSPPTTTTIHRPHHQTPPRPAPSSKRQVQGLLPLEPLQLQAAQRHAAPADGDRRVRERDGRVFTGAAHAARRRDLPRRRGQPEHPAGAW